MPVHKKAAGGAPGKHRGRRLELQLIPMRSNTIADDYISAGWLLSEMDKAGGARAYDYVYAGDKTHEGRAVTVGLDEMAFGKPVFASDRVKIYTQVVRQGRSSLTVLVESKAKRHGTHKVESVVSAEFTFVAIDRNKKPVEIKTGPPDPPLPGPRKSAHDTGNARMPTEAPTLVKVPGMNDRNRLGDIFGGWVLTGMDEACARIAHERTGREVAIVGLKAMTFHKPVLVDDDVKFFSKVEKIGRTSITIKEETWVKRKKGGEHEKVTEGLFTYVALDKNRKPTPIEP